MAAKSLVKENDKITKHYFLFINRVDNFFWSSNTKEINLVYEIAAEPCVQEIDNGKHYFLFIKGVDNLFYKLQYQGN